MKSYVGGEKISDKGQWQAEYRACETFTLQKSIWILFINISRRLMLSYGNNILP